MKVLGLETAGEIGSVGVVDSEKSLSEISFAATLKQGEKLFPAIDAALKLAEVDRSDLELIAVATGPGSFTGLRIGIAASKGVAQALNVPLVGVPSIDAYMRSASFCTGQIWVLLPDRRDWLYAGQFQKDRVIEEIRVWPFEEWLRKAKSDLRNDMLLIGPGVEFHREKLEKLQIGPLASSALNQPSGSMIAHLGLKCYQTTGKDESADLEPIYLHPAMAEAPKKPKATKIIELAQS